MIVLASAVFGALLGILTARKNGGNKKDMAQYAAGFGIAMTVVGVVITIVVARTVS
ncbi:hypothetical protein [Psychromarinibacter halotolerans]|uniref:Apolipoprotein acyltransferase n=1 Tax=Psychromarinibacter halotolerans TaxID=1775175 RepID=A0ABV7GYL5_9RHOB|nr:hypothetical protein [Psychromarinibacter halotolerans]MDF0598217.1 hypothetical protein [Psychromarinibacter halotolerans]